MPVFAAIYDYDASDDARRAELLGEHRAWLTGIDRDGALLEAGVLPARPGSIIVVTAADDADAAALFDADPFHIAGLVEHRAISEWNVRWGVVSAAAARSH
jgi:uncharacterized protein YciI